MTLSPTQTHHLASIKWLIDPYKYMGEGRTELLAYAFVQVAVEHAGQRIDFNHYVPPVLREHFRQKMNQIVNENYPNLVIVINKASLTVLVK